MCGGLCVSCLGNPKSVGVLSGLAGRNVQRRPLQQCMCRGLCVSYLGNPKFVGVIRGLGVWLERWNRPVSCIIVTRRSRTLGRECGDIVDIEH